ncbi:helix-turn-helix domain-containing protein [Nocardioides faecalis]|uniref:helix-turn-helix domain-containing protein n=1 Tax=Nocardioides faecalis TaxID=2803858 RepID=UPI0027DB39F5|nr:helix-turn-helix domain-containing protein [Nocardioides faecalis]
MSEIPPLPAALRGLLAARVAYDVDMGAPGVHRGLPSTTLTLVLPLDAPLRVSWADRPDSLHEGWTSLSGLSLVQAAIHHDGTQRGIQLALTVAGARALLGMPAGALAAELTDADAVGVTALRELPERLHGLDSTQEQVALVDRVLVDLARGAGSRGTAPRDGMRPEVAVALRALAGGARVGAVAASVGLSRRRLGDLVRAECGVRPKQLHRVSRFASARGLLGRLPLAEVAARCGFADQAHLTREWTALAGCSPTVWLREEFPFVQDEPVEGLAASQS